MLNNIRNRGKPSLDDVCELIKITYEKDELNQRVPTETSAEVFCAETAVTRSEFSAAAQAGIKPEVVLIIDSEEYDRQKLIRFNGDTFTVYKTYRREDGYTELYGESKTGER